MTNARNHKERWDARIARGLCGRCGVRFATPNFISCATCRSVERARRAARQATAASQVERNERLLALAVRKAKSRDAAALRRELGVPLSRSTNQRIAPDAMPVQEV